MAGQKWRAPYPKKVKIMQKSVALRRFGHYAEPAFADLMGRNPLAADTLFRS
jgi:hypothetical protein